MGFFRWRVTSLHAGCQVTVYNRTASKAQACEKNSAQSRPQHLVKPHKMLTSSLPVSAMTTICAVCCSGRRRFCRHEKRRRPLGRHHRFCRSRKKGKKWRKLESRGPHFVDAPVSSARTAQSAAVLPSCAAEMQKSLNASNRLRTLLRARFAESDRSAPDSLPRCAIRSVSPALFRA